MPKTTNYKEAKRPFMPKLMYNGKIQIEHKSISFGRYNIHYFISGKKDAPALIFLHGAYTDHRLFDKQLDEFEKDYRIITIDLLGHGASTCRIGSDRIDSTPKHIRAVLRTELIEVAHIIGVSMGGILAQYYAMLYPESVLSLTLIGSYNILKERENKAIMKIHRKNFLKSFIMMIGSMEKLRKYIAQSTSFIHREQEAIYQSTKSFTHSSFYALSGLNNLLGVRIGFKRKFPLLLVCGAFELSIYKEYSEQWRKHSEMCIFEQIPYAGHFAHLDNSEMFNKSLRHFLVTDFYQKEEKSEEKQLHEIYKKRHKPYNYA